MNNRARYTWEATIETRELLERVKRATGAPSLSETLRQALEHYAGVVGEGDGQVVPFYVSPRVREVLDRIRKRWEADSDGEVIRRSLRASDVLTGVEEARGERVVVIRSDGGMDRFLTT